MSLTYMMADNIADKILDKLGILVENSNISLNSLLQCID